MRFLATLPNNKDNLSPFCDPIRERLIEEFNQTKLTPMKQGGHAPASECYRGQKKLSDLIDHKDLATLLGKHCSQPLWIANPQQKNQSDDNFLSMLAISTWTIEDLIEVLETFEDITKWLEKKSNAWHQKLYAFFEDFLSSARSNSDSAFQERKDQLSNLRLVCCNDKNYRIGSECRFSNDDMKSDPPKDGTQKEGFHYVAKGVYSYGKNKSQQEKARMFLDKIGVSEWDIVDEVIKTILPKYEDNPPRVPIKEHMNHFKKITGAYNTCKQSRKMQLKTKLQATHFILAENPNADFPIYLKPDQIYFGTDADLRMYFERDSLMLLLAMVKDPITYLWEHFGEPDIGAFVDLDKYPNAAVKLFRDLGIESAVRVKREEKNWQGYVVVERFHGRHKRGLDGFDPNIQVDGLGPALDSPTPKKSAFIWNHIALPNVDYIKGVVEEATWQNYGNGSCKNVLSDSFGNLLVTKAWLPDIDGNMHKPSEISLAELPESFQHDERLANQLGMKKNEVAELAEKAGVPVEVIDKISQDPELCAKVEEFIAEQETRKHREKKVSEQPIQDENIINNKTPIDTSSIPSESLTNVDEEKNSSTAKDSETPEGSGHNDSVANKSTPHTSSRPSVSAPSSQNSSQGETPHTETGSGSDQHGRYGDRGDILLPEEISETEESYEGARKQISVNTYERDRTARNKCLQHYGTSCTVCEKDMSEIYGPEAAGLIHVHHLKPLSEIKENYRVNPIADLRPVCPNCHAVIHRQKPPYKIEKVKGILEKVRQDG